MVSQRCPLHGQVYALEYGCPACDADYCARNDIDARMSDPETGPTPQQAEEREFQDANDRADRVVEDLKTSKPLTTRGRIEKLHQQSGETLKRMRDGEQITGASTPLRGEFEGILYQR